MNPGDFIDPVKDAVLTWRAAKDELARNPQYHYAVSKQIAARGHGVLLREGLTLVTNEAVPAYGSPGRPKREMARLDMSVIEAPAKSILKAS